MHLLFVISASFILSPDYNAILLFRCFVVDFIVKSPSRRSPRIGVHFTGLVETCPVWSFYLKTWGGSHVGIFPGEVEHPRTFLVERTETFLLQERKVEGFSVKGMHQFVLPLDANKYTYIGFLLLFHWMHCHHRGTFQNTPCYAVRHELTKQFIFRLKRKKQLSSIKQSSFHHSQPKSLIF